MATMPHGEDRGADSEGGGAGLRARPSSDLSPEQVSRQTREDLRLLEGLLSGLGSETGEARGLTSILALIQRVIERNSTVLEACAERLKYLEEQIWLQR